MDSLVPAERIESRILLIRGEKVIIDRDLAELYGVTTGNLNKAVKRNMERFPEDFMLQLTKEEFDNLIFQNGISSWGGTRKLPYAFTEQGIAMLSSVLNSKRAISVNIQIMRVFTRLRRMALDYGELREKIEVIEKRCEEYDQDFKVVFEAIKALVSAPVKEIKTIGFKKP